MNSQRLKILFDIILEPGDNEDDIRSEFLSRDEDPDAIIERAKQFVNKKVAEIKLKEGKEKQNMAAEFLYNPAINDISVNLDNSSFGDLGFAYRKCDIGDEDNKRELNHQAEKLEKLKKYLDNNNERSGKS